MSAEFMNNAQICLVYASFEVRTPIRCVYNRQMLVVRCDISEILLF